MDNYGMNGENEKRGAEGQDNPAHNHNFSLQRYVADAERNVYLRRPIVRLPEERHPVKEENPDNIYQYPPTENNGREHPHSGEEKKKADDSRQSPVKRPVKDEYVPEPFLGYYPLAGRTTYIGSHKKRSEKKLAVIIALAIVIVLAFVLLNFGDRIFSSRNDTEKTTDEVCVEYCSVFSDI